MNLVYLDTETTGLDPTRHEIWEIAWAVDDEPIESGILLHSLRYADPVALSMNGYYQREFSGNQADEKALRADLEGATLVGANPAFDAGFLRARWGVTPWRYRLFDIEAYAMGALGFGTPKGLKDIYAALTELGWPEIPAPDHSAAGDVATLRACHKALQEIYARSGK